MFDVIEKHIKLLQLYSRHSRREKAKILKNELFYNFGRANVEEKSWKLSQNLHQSPLPNLKLRNFFRGDKLGTTSLLFLSGGKYKQKITGFYAI